MRCTSTCKNTRCPAIAVPRKTELVRYGPLEHHDTRSSFSTKSSHLACMVQTTWCLNAFNPTPSPVLKTLSVPELVSAPRPLGNTGQVHSTSQWHRSLSKRSPPPNLQPVDLLHRNYSLHTGNTHASSRRATYSPPPPSHHRVGLYDLPHHPTCPRSRSPGTHRKSTPQP